MRVPISGRRHDSTLRVGALAFLLAAIVLAAVAAPPAQAQGDPNLPAPVVGPRAYVAQPCGPTTVTFVPNPVNIPRGGTRTVTAQIRNKPVDNFLLNGTAQPRLLDSDFLSDDLLDSEDLTQELLADGAGANQCVNVDITYTLRCRIPDEIVGRLGSSGEAVAELSMEFVQFGTNVGAGVAQCVPDAQAAACVLQTRPPTRSRSGCMTPAAG